jgi:hypothetical protein
MKASKWSATVLFESSRHATDRQLRQFAAALVVASLLAISLRLLRQIPVGAVAATIGVTAIVLGIVGLVTPRRIAWLFSFAVVVTRPIGLVLSELILVVLYFAVVAPIAVAGRVAGRDRLKRRLDADAGSYWIRRRASDDLSRYFRQS